MVGTRFIPFAIFVMVAVVGITACSDRPAAFGQYFKGRNLVVSIVNIERVPEIRYAIPLGEQDFSYRKVQPSEPEQELVVVRLKVENHNATSTLFTMNKQGAELRDFDSEKYFPIDVGERALPAEGPPGRGDKSAQVLDLNGDGTFAPNRGFINGPFELKKGTGLDGWLIFEAPKDTLFRSFRWRASDSLTIDF